MTDGICWWSTRRVEAREPPLRPIFDRRIKLEFHGARITSDDGLLAYRELDDVLGLTEIAITKLLEGRRGKNGRHTLGGLFRQSVFGTRWDKSWSRRPEAGHELPHANGQVAAYSAADR